MQCTRSGAVEQGVRSVWAVLRRHISPSRGVCSLRHALDEGEQAVPFEREREVREDQALERGWKDSGRLVGGTVQEHRSATGHGGGNGVGLRERHPGLDEYGEWRVESCQLPPFRERVNHGRRVAGAGK